MTDIELEETLARIRQLRIDSEHKEEDIRRIIAEHDKTRQDITLEPWKLVVGAFTAGAAVLGGALALFTFILHLLGKI
jgi:hypothetical protein